VELETLRALLDARACMQRQCSEGSTGPEQVRVQLGRLGQASAAARQWAAQQRGALDEARRRTATIVAAVLAGQPLASAGLPEV
jgi:hypothetical protein